MHACLWLSTGSYALAASTYFTTRPNRASNASCTFWPVLADVSMYSIPCRSAHARPSASVTTRFLSTYAWMSQLLRGSNHFHTLLAHTTDGTLRAPYSPASAIHWSARRFVTILNEIVLHTKAVKAGSVGNIVNNKHLRRS